MAIERLEGTNAIVGAPVPDKERHMFCAADPARLALVSSKGEAKKMREERLQEVIRDPSSIGSQRWMFF